MHPASLLYIRRRVYLLLLVAGLGCLFSLLLSDLDLTLTPASTIPIAAQGGGPQPLTTGTVMDGFGTWSPDGKQIAFMRDGRIWLMSATGADPRPLTAPTGAWDTVSAWRPDGKRLAFVRLSPDGRKAKLMLIDPAAGKEEMLLDLEEPASHIAWAPAGGVLYYTTQNRLQRLDVGARKKVATVHTVPDGWEMQAGGLTISPDGKMAVFGAGPQVGRTVQYDLWQLPLAAKGAERERLTRGGGIMPVFTADGKELIYRNPRAETGLYRMQLATHATKLLLADEPRAIYFHPAPSRDGRRLLFSRLVLEAPPGTEGQRRFTSTLHLHTLSASRGD